MPDRNIVLVKQRLETMRKLIKQRYNADLESAAVEVGSERNDHALRWFC